MLQIKRWLVAGVSFFTTLLMTFGSVPQTLSQSETFSNPILWEDLPDLDIIRVGDAYYYSASNMHYSPGAPILRSYDLLHWDYVGHSVPVLDFSPAYDLNGGRAYVKGTWASFLGYRKSNKLFYWGGCVEFKHTYIYTAPAAEGPWSRSVVLDPCYYDAGLLVDDDDTMYVAYGQSRLHVAQLSPDGKHEVKNEIVFQSPPAIGTLEGSRFYKIKGNYYIFTTHSADAEYVLRSTHGPFGPYEIHPLLQTTKSPVTSAGVPHQGGIVQTEDGRWYYMAFIDAYPGGRVPVLAPVKWTEDGWPSLELVDNTWQPSYPTPVPNARPYAYKPHSGSDHFDGATLAPEWEWNHNPDNAKWSLNHGLRLQTASVTDDLYAARNTLTHRVPGPASTATVVLDPSAMREGDRAGLAMLRDASAWIGVVHDAGNTHLSVVQDIAMDKTWQTVSKGHEVASAPLNVGKVWLRVSADVRPGAARTSQFSYSTDGLKYTPLGTPFLLNSQWQFFMGYRFGIFNYATKALGGTAKILTFEISTP